MTSILNRLKFQNFRGGMPTNPHLPYGHTIFMCFLNLTLLLSAAWELPVAARLPLGDAPVTRPETDCVPLYPQLAAILTSHHQMTPLSHWSRLNRCMKSIPRILLMWRACSSQVKTIYDTVQKHLTSCPQSLSLKNQHTNTVTSFSCLVT